MTVSVNSLPAATSLAIDGLLGTTVEDRGDHVVVRTPERPSYHWGNCIHVTAGDVDAADHWLRVFRRAFPKAPYRAVGLWQAPHAEPWRRHGLHIQVSEALVRCDSPPAAPVPNGYTIAAVVHDRHWAARRAQELDENARDGDQPADGYADFVDADIAARRRLVRAGHAAWFGTFTAEGALASSLGIVVLGARARYQYVLTDPAHRRLGLARALLTTAAEWAIARRAHQLVIVADEGSDAARLYHHAGFSPAGTDHAAYAPSVVDAGS